MKDIPQQMKRADSKTASKSTEICAAVFDLQKVLFTPKCEASLLYYHRKLSSYNFTVYDLAPREGFCYCWDESVGKRGANEIASCLLAFIEERVKKGIKKFCLFADNCAGQNKNRMVFAMLMHLAAKWNIDIKLVFLVTGHTQNEGDSMHARIENETKACTIHSPEQWITKIAGAKKDGKPYNVKVITQEDILDFHDFVDKKSFWKTNTDGESVSWLTSWARPSA